MNNDVSIRCEQPVPVDNGHVLRTGTAMLRLDRLRPAQATLIVQLVQSASSLAATALILATLSSAEFGLFAVIQASALLMNGVVDSGALVPLLVRYARTCQDSGGRRLAAFDWTLLLGMVGLAILLGCAMTLLLPNLGESIASVPSLALAAAWLGLAIVVREWSRQRLLIQGRLATLVLTDVIGSLLMLVSIAVVVLVPGLPGPGLVGMVLLSSMIGVVPVVMLARSPGFYRRPRTHFMRLVKMGRWSFASSQVSWVQSQTYLYFVAVMLSTAAAGVLAAARVFFLPLQNIVAGLSRGLLAQLAAAAGQDRDRRAMHALRRFFLIASVVFVLWTGLILAIAPYFDQQLADRGYNFSPGLLLAWAGVFYFSSGRTVVTQVLRAFGAFHRLTVQGALGSSLSLLLTPILILSMGQIGAVLALAFAEAAALAMGLMSVRKLTLPSPGSAA